MPFETSGIHLEEMQGLVVLWHRQVFRIHELGIKGSIRLSGVPGFRAGKMPVCMRNPRARTALLLSNMVGSVRVMYMPLADGFRLLPLVLVVWGIDGP